MTKIKGVPTQADKDMLDLERLLKTYPKLIELSTDMADNLTKFLHYLRDSDFYLMITNDKDGMKAMDKFVGAHMDKMQEMGLLVQKALSREPN